MLGSATTDCTPMPFLSIISTGLQRAFKFLLDIQG